MRQPTKLFKPSSVGAGASLLVVVLLMLGNPFLILTFFVCMVYAVVPFSLWRKHRTLFWRTSIILTCAAGYGIIALGLILEMIGSRQPNEFEIMLPGFASLRLAFVVGVVFLPLAGIGSMHSLVSTIRARQRLKEQSPGERDITPNA